MFIFKQSFNCFFAFFFSSNCTVDAVLQWAWILRALFLCSVLTYCISLACVSMCLHFPCVIFLGGFHLFCVLRVCACSGVWWQFQGWVYRANPFTWVSLSLWQQPEVHLDNWGQLWQHCQVIQVANNDNKCICMSILQLVLIAVVFVKL